MICCVLPTFALDSKKSSRIEKTSNNHFFTHRDSTNLWGDATIASPNKKRHPQVAT